MQPLKLVTDTEDALAELLAIETELKIEHSTLLEQRARLNSFATAEEKILADMRAIHQTELDNMRAWAANPSSDLPPAPLTTERAAAAKALASAEAMSNAATATAAEIDAALAAFHQKQSKLEAEITAAIHDRIEQEYLELLTGLKNDLATLRHTAATCAGYQDYLRSLGAQLNSAGRNDEARNVLQRLNRVLDNGFDLTTVGPSVGEINAESLYWTAAALILRSNDND